MPAESPPACTESAAAEKRVANMETEYTGDGPSGYGRSGSAEENIPGSYATPDSRWDELQLSGELARLQAGLGPAPVTLRWPGCTAEQAVSAIARDGFVIVDGAVSEATCDKVLAELSPHLECENLGLHARRAI